MHSNTKKCTKNKFGIQSGGSGAFVAKNSVVTSWHELLHLLHYFSPFCTEYTATTKHSQIHPSTMKCSKT